MTDTPADVAATFRRLCMARTEGERALMAFEMFGVARTLMIADIRASSPGITGPELRALVFERTYGRDFDEPERSRLADILRRG